MKHILSHLLKICIFTTLPLYAQTIDEQIRAIQNAPVAERFKRMNAFKKKLVKMKEAERIEALKKLAHSSKRKDANKVLQALKKQMMQQKIRQELETQHINVDNIQNQDENENGDDDD